MLVLRGTSLQSVPLRLIYWDEASPHFIQEARDVRWTSSVLEELALPGPEPFTMRLHYSIRPLQKDRQRYWIFAS
jgi:hypothetical protein